MFRRQLSAATSATPLRLRVALEPGAARAARRRASKWVVNA